MESIFQLDGSASVSSDRKVIDIEMNPKEPDLMNKLYKGLQILNTIQVHDLERRGIEAVRKILEILIMILEN